MKKTKPIIVGGMALALLVRSIPLSTVDVFAMEITSSTTISQDVTEIITVGTASNGTSDEITITIENGVNISDINCGDVYVAEGDTVTIINYGTVEGASIAEGVSFVNYGTVTQLFSNNGDITLYDGCYINDLMVEAGTLQVMGNSTTEYATFAGDLVTTGNGAALYVNKGLRMDTTQSESVPIIVGTDTNITATYDVTVGMDGCGEFFIPKGTATATFGELYACEITVSGLDANLGRMMGDSSMTGGSYTVFTNTGSLPLTVDIGSLDSAYYDFTTEHSTGDVLNPSESMVINFSNKKGLASGSYTDSIELALSGFRYTLTVSHEFVEVPDNPIVFSGTVGDNDFYVSDVTITAAEGFSIAYVNSGDYVKSLTFYEGEYDIYLDARHDDTGTLWSQNSRYKFTIDKDAPTIEGVEEGKEYYTEAQELSVDDDYLSTVTINSEPIGMVDDTLVLSSNGGVEAYEVIAKDLAGNETSVRFIVLAEWVRSGVVPCDTLINLQDEYTYNFGEGTYNVEGDTTSYTGDGSFYVRGDGEYMFTKE